MPRYIDADALVKRLKHSPLFLGTNMQFKDGVIDLVERQPAADAVEVVRCKDCKYLTKEMIGDSLEFICKSAEGMVNPAPDFYCSYGKRKEGE